MERVLILRNREWVPRERDENEPREPRKPKRKVAVMIGYCGTGYHGMQINPPNKTIEEDLYKAFVDAGAISKDNSSDLKKSGFMRAARTDKGVHAAGNVVSLKLIIEDPDVVEKINTHLPDQIRVWGISRTNKAFECRKMCSSRIYEYLIPSYSFLPPKPESALAERLTSASKKYPGAIRDDLEGKKFWEDIKAKLVADGVSESDIRRVQKIAEDDEQEHMKQTQQKILDARAKSISSANGEISEETSEEKQTETVEVSKPEDTEETETKRKFSEIVKKIKAAEHEARRAYRISPERLELIRKTIKQYEGVHNFHNFTIGKTFKDPSAMRNMKSLTVSEPKIIENTEWLSIKIHGQSFMMHQIRKMIAMTALLVRCGTPITRLKDAFNSPDLNIPKAPGLGLLLEQPVYDGYNTRLGSFGYDPLNFEKWQVEVEAFKFKHIYDKIYSEEDREHVFHKFFSFIDSFRGDSTFDYLCVGPKDAGQDAAADESSSSGKAVTVAVVAGAAAAAVVSKFVMDDDDEDDKLPPDADTEG